MENLPNQNEQFAEQLQETNNHLKKVQNILVGILIATGIVALAIIIVATKLGELFGGGGN